MYELPYLPPLDAIRAPSDDTLKAAARNIAESDRPRDGYPGLIAGYPDRRLFMTREEVLAATFSEEVCELADGTFTKIKRIYLPPGHDTVSASRQTFLDDPHNVENLIYPPTSDIITGSDHEAPEVAFQRWLAMGFRIFDQHDRVLPGTYKRIIRLLGVRSQGRYGARLGMPVGNGTFASPGAHPASDPFILMPLPDGDYATLVVGRPPTEQSHEVWGPPGGFGSKKDIVDGRYSSWQAAVRLCLQKTGFYLGEFTHRRVHVEAAISSPTTINSVLIPESHVVAVPFSRGPQVGHEIPTGTDVQGALWLSVRALLRVNNTLRRKGQSPHFDHAKQPDHIYWDTHMRGLLAALNAMRNAKTALS